MNYSAFSVSVSTSLSPAELMARLRAAVDEATNVAQSVRGAISLFEDLFRHRVQLGRALATLQAVAPNDRDRVLREAQLAYIRHERDVTTHGRSGLVRGWTSLLIEATDKVRHDRQDAEKFAVVAGTRSADDRAWIDAAAASGERWQRTDAQPR